MKRMRLKLILVWTLLPIGAHAHPGSGIAVDSKGNVWVSDINRGLLKFSPEGEVTVVLKEAGHWLALDAGERFARLEFETSSHWPRWFKHRNPPGTGLAFISDGGSPLTIHGDGNLYYVCSDEGMVPGGLQIGRLSPGGELTLVAPGMKARVEELGGIKGLAAGPDDSLFAVCPSAVLKVKLDGTFATVKQSIMAPDCDRYLPPNTLPAHEPFLTGLVVSPGGDIYLAATGCRCVLKLEPQGRVSTVLKAEPPWSPTAMALQGEDLYVAEWTNAHSEAHDFQPRVRKVGRDGNVTTLATFPTTEAVPATNTPSRRGNRGAANSNDAYYTLGPDSQPRPGVPAGKLTEAKVIPSQVFPGTQHTYWVYVPAQYDPLKPTALMVFNDGQAMKVEPGDVQAPHVLDNLIFRREIPVMLGVFINPGRRPDQPEPNPSDWGDNTTNRRDEYNPPNDRYARVVVEELLPALKKEYHITPDPELRGIMGASSGGCAAFAVAWFRPNEFRKVITFVGSFTDIRGQHIYPELVATSEKKPIRIFLQDGRNDNRRPGRPNNDWFLQNVRLMQALSQKGYDVNYAWGIGNHGQKQGGAIFPEMMRWLWRDQPVSTDPEDQVERSLRNPKPAAVEAMPPAEK